MDLLALAASVEAAVEAEWNPPLSNAELRRYDRLVEAEADAERAACKASPLTIAERIAENDIYFRRTLRWA